MYFFFSYSRQNNENFLRDFYAELNKTVQDMVGLKEDAGFFDQTGLEPGEFWESKLEQALGGCRVFVAAVTAGQPEYRRSRSRRPLGSPAEGLAGLQDLSGSHPARQQRIR